MQVKLEQMDKQEESATRGRMLPHILDSNILGIESNLNERIDISTHRRETRAESECFYALQIVSTKFLEMERTD